MFHCQIYFGLFFFSFESQTSAILAKCMKTFLQKNIYDKIDRQGTWKQHGEICPWTFYLILIDPQERKKCLHRLLYDLQVHPEHKYFWGPENNIRLYFSTVCATTTSSAGSGMTFASIATMQQPRGAKHHSDNYNRIVARRGCSFFRDASYKGSTNWFAGKQFWMQRQSSGKRFDRLLIGSDVTNQFNT